ncbi:MAG: choice-of-anchor A family protein, partial [Phycisphaerales bacterium]|nr:choice-of-anchor A family protein [Phycisphaerales bacterium]
PNNGSTIDMNPTAAQAIIAAAAAELPAWSSSLQGLGGAAISLPGSQPGPVNLNAAPDEYGVATFSVGNGSNLFNNNKVQQIDLVWNDADYVVVNVGGTSIQWNHGNMVGGLTTEYARSHVIWNFFEATSIRLEGRGFNGALLAPNAWLRVDGVVEGSVFVKSFRQEGEVHLPTFAAAEFPLPPAPIPEPGTFFLVVAGLALMRPLRHRAVSRAS